MSGRQRRSAPLAITCNFWRGEPACRAEEFCPQGVDLVMLFLLSSTKKTSAGCHRHFACCCRCRCSCLLLHLVIAAAAATACCMIRV